MVLVLRMSPTNAHVHFFQAVVKSTQVIMSNLSKLLCQDMDGLIWKSNKIFFQLNNTDPTAAKKLYPLVANPQAFFRRVKVFLMELSRMIWIILIGQRK